MRAELRGDADEEDDNEEGDAADDSSSVAVMQPGDIKRWNIYIGANFTITYILYVSVSEWIDTYGYDPDPEYRFKRSRRIVENTFKHMLTLKYVRLQSKYGAVFLEHYPAELSERELSLGKHC